MFMSSGSWKGSASLSSRSMAAAIAFCRTNSIFAPISMASRCWAPSDPRELKLDTPFGDPSDVYVLGKLEGKRVAFLTLHGRGHRILPHELNFRANIYGFKMLGAERPPRAEARHSLRRSIRCICPREAGR